MILDASETPEFQNGKSRPKSVVCNLLDKAQVMEKIEAANQSTFKEFPSIKRQVMSLAVSLCAHHRMNEKSADLILQKVNNEVLFNLNKLRTQQKIDMIRALENKSDTCSITYHAFSSANRYQDKQLSPSPQAREKKLSHPTENSLLERVSSKRRSISYNHRGSDVIPCRRQIDHEEYKSKDQKISIQSYLNNYSHTQTRTPLRNVGELNRLNCSNIQGSPPSRMANQQSLERQTYQKQMQQVLEEANQMDIHFMKERQMKKQYLVQDLRADWDSAMKTRKHEAVRQKQSDVELMKIFDFREQVEMQEEQRQLDHRKRAISDDKQYVLWQLNSSKEQKERQKQQQLEAERQQLIQMDIEHEREQHRQRAEDLTRIQKQNLIIQSHIAQSKNQRERKEILTKVEEIRLLKYAITKQHEQQVRNSGNNHFS